jgi:hypothetical protein
MPDYTQSLHRLKDEVNQWRQLQAHIEGVTANIKDAIAATLASAPVRNLPFELDRTDGGNPKGPEAKWERAIWDLWGRDFRSPSYFLDDVCQYIHTFAMPLYATQNQDGWGEVDLVGVDSNYLPVVIELKEPGAPDTPLKIMLQAAAYGIAIQKVWGEGPLREAWKHSISQIARQGVADTLPDKLETVHVVGLVPDGYLAAQGPEKRGIFEQTKEGMHRLVSILEKYGLHWTFASISGAERIV